MNYEVSQTRSWPVQVVINAEARHRALMILTVAAAVTLTAALAAYGWNYYILDEAQRPYSPLHAQLRPSGTVGLKLGMFGLFLFSLVYVYPLRKRWTWLSRQGKATHWLNFHMILGLVAPAVITFHSASKMHGFAGMAYWTLLALMASGIIGRYFHAQIPRTLDAATMTLKQMQVLSNQFVDEGSCQRFVSDSERAHLFHLPDVQEVAGMSLIKALYKMIVWDLSRPCKIWSLRRHKENAWGKLWTLGGILPSKHKELEMAISLVSRQAALSKRILFLSKAERVLHLWHVIHRPFSLSFAILVIIHVGVVVSLGYF